MTMVIAVAARVEQGCTVHHRLAVPRVIWCQRLNAAVGSDTPPKPIMSNIIEGFEQGDGDRGHRDHQKHGPPTPKAERDQQGHFGCKVYRHPISKPKARSACPAKALDFENPGFSNLPAN